MGDIAALAQRHSHAHTSEQRAAALALAASVQGDTYPADIIWAEAGTRTLTESELRAIGPRAVKAVPQIDRPKFWRGVAQFIELAILTATLLFSSAFLVAQAAKYLGVW